MWVSRIKSPWIPLRRLLKVKTVRSTTVTTTRPLVRNSRRRVTVRPNDTLSDLLRIHYVHCSLTVENVEGILFNNIVNTPSDSCIVCVRGHPYYDGRSGPCRLTRTLLSLPTEKERWWGEVNTTCGVLSSLHPEFVEQGHNRDRTNLKWQRSRSWLGLDPPPGKVRVQTFFQPTLFRRTYHTVNVRR